MITVSFLITSLLLSFPYIKTTIYIFQAITFVVYSTLNLVLQDNQFIYFCHRQLYLWTTHLCKGLCLSRFRYQYYSVQHQNLFIKKSHFQKQSQIFCCPLLQLSIFCKCFLQDQTKKFYDFISSFGTADAKSTSS